MGEVPKTTTAQQETTPKRAPFVVSRRSVIAGLSALGSRVFFPGRANAEAELPVETPEQKLKAFMNRVIQPDKLPQEGEAKWSEEKNPARTKTICKYNPGSDPSVIFTVEYLVAPNGDNLQTVLYITQTDKPGARALIGDGIVEQTMSVYIKDEGLGNLKDMPWKFSGGGNIPPQAQRMLKTDEVMVVEAIRLFGKNDETTGQFEAVVGEFSNRTTQYAAESGFK